MQILTKKKQIRGNKVPNDEDSNEAESELRRQRGREAEMSVRERQRVIERVGCDLG